MRAGAWYLARQHARHHWGQTAVLTLCLALTIFLPAATRFLIGTYQRQLMARAAASPMVAGARGNRFDLTLAALYFRPSALEPVPFGELQRLADEAGLAIPLNLRFTARGYPLVGTSPEYYERRGLAAARGELPLVIGDAVLGSAVARALGLGPGDVLFSDPRDLYDISKPSALKLGVCGVLAPSGTPDDEAVFVDVKTTWILEGLAHGHDDVETGLDESLILARSGDGLTVSPAMIEYNEVTPENAASFHHHGDLTGLPLSAVLVFPDSDKAGTLAKARVNAEGRWQMLVPREVIADLMGFVFRIQAFFDSFSGVLATTTALLTALVLLLSTRLRAAEMAALHRIGCSRATVARLFALEIGLVLAMGLVLAAVGVVAVGVLLPDLVDVF